MASPVTSAPIHRQIPRATYRLQFTEQFRLPDALALVPYLHELGVSHIYASPLLKAVPHSAHGYDVCDFGQLNPELGTEADLAELADALHKHGMGLVLDIVPNHMGVGTPENRWWWDVLANGAASPYARYFDIDWRVPDPRTTSKVLLPVLGDYYHRELEKGHLKFQHQDGHITVRYFDHQFPLNQDSLKSLQGGPHAHDPGAHAMAGTLAKLNANPAAIDAILQKQFYRLTFWRHGDAELNYRRFFAIATLAGISAERKEVFEASHKLIFEWMHKGWVDGLRVDHPDGLRLPLEYLRQLRRRAPPAWIVVEKILSSGEALPQVWPVNGTTGYDFINRVDGLLLDRNGSRALTDSYRKMTGESLDYSGQAREKQLFILGRLFQSEVARLTRLLAAVANEDWRWKDFSRRELRQVIEEMAAAFPVYRTYINPAKGGVSATDQEYIEQAFAAARKNRPDLPPEIFEFCRDVLLLRAAGKSADEFVLRFQQLTVSTMAKGVEDTVFYSFNRFVVLNEVGEDPGKFGLSIRDFHAACATQQKHWPDSMLATSTHDTKRSEDVRARLNVISEIPQLWSETVERWTDMNKRHHQHGWPDRNAEYLFYQTVAGAWPLSTDRAIAYMNKAASEAKQHTDWTEPNESYQAALKTFIKGVLNDADFIRDLETFLKPIIETGLVNSLAQTMLKLTLPGVPDLYQGTELWDFSLVDPDNRRPVDFAARRSTLMEAGKIGAAEAWERRTSGIAKIWLIQRVLALRAAKPDLLAGSSSYEPLLASGAKGHHAVAFMRNGEAVVVVPRLTLTLNNDWGDTVIALPGAQWKNALTDEVFNQDMVALSAVLRDFPVALLLRTEGR